MATTAVTQQQAAAAAGTLIQAAASIDPTSKASQIVAALPAVVSTVVAQSSNPDQEAGTIGSVILSMLGSTIFTGGAAATAAEFVPVVGPIISSLLTLFSYIHHGTPAQAVPVPPA